MGRIFTSCEICKSCKYYQQLYTKEKTRFKTINGWCTNERKCARNVRKYCLEIRDCEYWEKGEDKTVEQDECIRKVIYDMREKLTKLLELIENEE